MAETSASETTSPATPPRGRVRRYLAAAEAALRTEREKAPILPRVSLPIVLAVAAAVILIVNVAMLIIGGQVIGIGPDEPVHVDRFRQLLTTGWYIPSFLLENGESTLGDTYVYAPAAMLVAHLTAVASGAEEFTSIATTQAAYLARHFAIGMFAVAGLAAVAATARLLFRSWLWALLAAAVLSAIPMWTGHGMFNIKDVPVAAGFTVFTLGLVLLGRPGGLIGWLRPGLAVAAMAGGIFFAVGTRPGMWPALTLSALVTLGGGALFNARRIDRRPALRAMSARAALIAAAGLVAYLALLLLYPNAFARPLTVAIYSIGESAGYGYAQKAPWNYLPDWFSHQIPLILLVLAVIGVVVLIVGLIRALLPSGRGKLQWGMEESSIPVLAQALVMPLAAMVIQPTIYGAMRQFLFVIPAWALISTAGVWWLARVSDGMRRGRMAARISLVVVVIAGLVMPTIDQYRLFPFNYTYYNEITTLGPVNGRWATDYWRLSERELADRLNIGATGLCPNGYAKGPFDWRPGPILLGYPECRTNDNFTVFDDSRPTAAEPAPQLTSTQYWLVLENNSGYHIPQNCELYDEVTRPLRQQDLMMSYAAICELAFPQLPATGQARADQLNETAFLHGWSLPPSGAGAWSLGQLARLGITLPGRLEGKDLRLRLVGERLVPDGEQRRVEVFVNGVDVGGADFPQDVDEPGVDVLVPEDVAGKMGEGRMEISLRTPRPVTPTASVLGRGAVPVGFLLRSIAVEDEGR